MEKHTFDECIGLPSCPSELAGIHCSICGNPESYPIHIPEQEKQEGNMEGAEIDWIPLEHARKEMAELRATVLKQEQEIASLKARAEELREALTKLRGAVDGLALDYPYLTECKAEALRAISENQ